MDCTIGDDLRCSACGKPARSKTLRRNCGPARQSSQPGLGDMVASGLASVGITKERVQAVASAVGVKDCGCGKRQAALNKLGEMIGLPPGQT